MGGSADVPGSTAASLLEQARAHDPAAWRRLVALYGPLVYSWARRWGLPAEDAADVVQEVFRAVVAHLGQYRRDRPGDTFRGWLWTISPRAQRMAWSGPLARKRRSASTSAFGRSPCTV